MIKFFLKVSGSQNVLSCIPNSWKSLSGRLILRNVMDRLQISLIYILTFHDGGRYHIETSPLICSPNQWTGFYMITASVMKGLSEFVRLN